MDGVSVTDSPEVEDTELQPFIEAMLFAHP
jgi:hypothetical protein